VWQIVAAEPTARCRRIGGDRAQIPDGNHRAKV
jgi:hypothetical protein